MKNEEINALLTEYRNEFIDDINSDINKTILGFVSNNFCKLFAFNLLLHCVENINIFTEEQVDNIFNCLNSVS